MCISCSAFCPITHFLGVCQWNRALSNNRGETWFCGNLDVNFSLFGVRFVFLHISTLLESAMSSYTVTIATGNQWFAGTDDYIYITLVGTEECSERTLLDKPLYNDFERGAVSDVTVAAVEPNASGFILNTCTFRHAESVDTLCMSL